MLYQTLSLEHRPPLALISLTRPQSGNRIDRLLIAELRDAVQSVVDGQAARAMVLTGSGGIFSLGWASDFVADLETGVSAGTDLLGSTFEFLASAPIPVIAAINGDAFSAGFELALACDLRLAASRARMALPDTSEGQIPMAGGTQRLPRLVSRGLAVEMILTGRMLNADEALRAGIVSEIAEPNDLLEAAFQIGSAVARRGPLAIRLAKEAVRRGLDMPIEQALRYETDLTVLLQTTADRTEGVRAFIEKREPDFHGR